MAIRSYQGRRPDLVTPQGDCRLFCFPYAGAGAAVFSQWPDHLPPHIELCLPCLPARDARFGEPPDPNMDRIVASLTHEILPLARTPYALFGHSMGAFLAFDLAHDLSNRGHPPVHLFVSAQRGPRLPYPARPILPLPDDEFLAAIRARYDSIPEGVLAEKELMAMVLPMLRADFLLVENYRYRATARLACPITAFGGLNDSQITRPQLDAWSSETSAAFRLHMLTGGHLFLNSARPDLLSLIRAQFAARTRPCIL